MSEMTDEEFLDYCDAHSETPRCGFVPAQLSRLLRLAGQEDSANMWAMERNAVHDCKREWIADLVARGRAGIRGVAPR